MENNNSNKPKNTTPKKKTAVKNTTKKTTAKKTATKEPVKTSDIPAENIKSNTENNIEQTKTYNTSESIGVAIFYLGLGVIGGMVIYGAKKIIDNITE